MLEAYLRKYERPMGFYTDKASHFQVTQKRRRDRPGEDIDPVEMGPTQIGRALRELGIAWTPAHSPQAKGRVERSFRTAQDRLVKGLRVAGAKTIEDANRFLEQEFLPWWKQHMTVVPANPTHAHRPLGPQHDLAAILSIVETRTVANDYTFQFESKRYQIDRQQVWPGLRGGIVHIESRLDGTMAVRFGPRYLAVTECIVREKATTATKTTAGAKGRAKPTDYARETHSWLFRRSKLPTWRAGAVDRTRTSDRLE